MVRKFLFYFKIIYQTLNIHGRRIALTKNGNEVQFILLKPVAILHSSNFYKLFFSDKPL